MDLSKVYKTIQNLDSYINLTSELESKDEDYTIEVTVENVKFLKTLHALEVEYFVKYEKTGAAHIIFKKILQTASSKSRIGEELASLLKYWIEAVRHHLVKYPNWWRFLRNSLILVQKVSNLDSEVRNNLLEVTTENLLYLATEQNVDIDKKYLILKSISKCAKKSRHEIREKILGRSANYFNNLSRYMGTCGHKELQLAVLELLISFLPRHHYPACRAAFAPHWFPPDVFCEAAVEVFMQRSFTYFERDSFDLLEAQNQFTGTVLSVPCKKLSIGLLVVISEEINRKCWLNLNIGTKCMTVVLPRDILSNLGVQDSDASSDTDDLLTLAEPDVTSLELCGGPEFLEVKVKTLNDPQFIYEGSKKILENNGTASCYNLAIRITCDREKVHRALLAIFQDKYQSDENSVIDGTQQNVTKKPSRIRQGHAIFRRNTLTNSNCNASTNSNCTASSATSSLTQFVAKVILNERVPFPKTFLPILSKPIFKAVLENSEPPSSVDNSFKITEQNKLHYENFIEQTQDRNSTYQAQPCGRKSSELVEQLLNESFNYKRNPEKTNERSEFDASEDVGAVQPIVANVPILSRTNSIDIPHCTGAKATKKGCVIVSTDDSSTSNDVSLVENICEMQKNKRTQKKITYPKLNLRKQVRIVIKKLTDKDLRVNGDVGNVTSRSSSVNELEKVHCSPDVNRKEIQILNETAILGCEDMERKKTKPRTKGISKRTNSTTVDVVGNTVISPRRDISIINEDTPLINVRKRRRLYSPKDDFQLEQVRESNAADTSKNKSSEYAKVETPHKKTTKKTELKKRTNSNKVDVVSDTAICPRRDTSMSNEDTPLIDLRKRRMPHHPEDYFQQVRENNVADTSNNKSSDYSEVETPRKKMTKKIEPKKRLNSNNVDTSRNDLRKRRMPYHLEDDIQLEQIQEYNIADTSKNKSSDYSDVEAPRKTEQWKLAAEPSELSPKTLKNNNVFDKLMEGVDTTDHIKPISLRSRDINVYNYSSESDSSERRQKAVTKRRKKKATPKAKLYIPTEAIVKRGRPAKSPSKPKSRQRKKITTQKAGEKEIKAMPTKTTTKQKSQKTKQTTKKPAEVVNLEDEIMREAPRESILNTSYILGTEDINQDTVPTKPSPQIHIEPIVEVITAPDESGLPSPKKVPAVRNKKKINNRDTIKDLNVTDSPMPSLIIEKELSESNDSLNPKQLQEILNLLKPTQPKEAEIVMNFSPRISERLDLTESNAGSRNMTPVSGIVHLDDIDNVHSVTRNELNVIDLEENNSVVEISSLAKDVDETVRQCLEPASKGKHVDVLQESPINMQDAVQCDTIFDQSEIFQIAKRFKSTDGTQKPKSKMTTLRSTDQIRSQSKRKILTTDDELRIDIRKRQVSQKGVENGLFFDESNLVRTVSPIRMCSSPEVEVNSELESSVSLRDVLSGMIAAKRRSPDNIAHSPILESNEHSTPKDVSLTLDKDLNSQSREEELIEKMMQNTLNVLEDKLTKAKGDINKKLTETQQEIDTTITSLAVDVTTHIMDLYNNMCEKLQPKDT